MFSEGLILGWGNSKDTTSSSFALSNIQGVEKSDYSMGSNVIRDIIYLSLPQCVKSMLGIFPVYLEDW